MKNMSKIFPFLYIFSLLNVFFYQVAETWTSVPKVEKAVERTLIASTPMAAITVSAKLDLKEIHVRFFQDINR